MTDKELKRLSRRELFEMLITQTRRVELLEKQLQQATEQLESKKLDIKEAGDLAQAVLKLNGVFDAAASASSQYLENIKAMEEDCRIRCEEMLERAKEEASRIISEAKEQ